MGYKSGDRIDLAFGDRPQTVTVQHIAQTTALVTLGDGNIMVFDVDLLEQLSLAVREPEA